MHPYVDWLRFCFPIKSKSVPGVARAYIDHVYANLVDASAYYEIMEHNLK